MTLNLVVSSITGSVGLNSNPKLRSSIEILVYEDLDLR